MTGEKLPFRHGLAWVIYGITLWRRRPGILILALIGYQIILHLVAKVPLFGVFLPGLILPALFLSIMNILRAIDEQRLLSVAVLIEDIQHNARSLLLAGVLLNLLLLTPAIVIQLFFDSNLTRILTSEAMPQIPLKLSTGDILLVLCSLIVQLIFTFVPFLVGWWRMPVLKALSLSLTTFFYQWRALLCYSLALSVVPLLILVLLPLFLSQALIGGITAIIFIAFFLPICFTSFYVCARDIFKGRRN